MSNNSQLNNNGNKVNDLTSQSFICRKTINFIKKCIKNREEKSENKEGDVEEYKYITNKEIEMIENYEKTVDI